jgi:hypothetical protein
MFMRKPLTLAALVCAAALMSPAAAQPPRGRPAEEPAKDKPADAPLVTRMMALDKNKDGKLTKDEVTDERLQRLFEQADANKDGTVTKEELTALAARTGPDRGPGRPGGPGRGPGFPGRGPGGFGGPPQPGQILAPFLRERLNLTAEQKKKLDELQKEVDSNLDKILTEEQKKQLKEMRERGPGGRGPGGPPPGGEGRRPGRRGGDRPPDRRPPR